jgi:Na+/H+-dicarboxylate symporter
MTTTSSPDVQDLRPQAQRPDRSHWLCIAVVLGAVPALLVSAMTSGQVLQTLFVALLVGFVIQVLGSRADRRSSDLVHAVTSTRTTTQ